MKGIKNLGVLDESVMKYFNFEIFQFFYYGYKCEIYNIHELTEIEMILLQKLNTKL